MCSKNNVLIYKFFKIMSYYEYKGSLSIITLSGDDCSNHNRAFNSIGFTTVDDYVNSYPGHFNHMPDGFESTVYCVDGKCWENVTSSSSRNTNIFSMVLDNPADTFDIINSTRSFGDFDGTERLEVCSSLTVDEFKLSSMYEESEMVESNDYFTVSIKSPRNEIENMWICSDWIEPKDYMDWIDNNE